MKTDANSYHINDDCELLRVLNQFPDHGKPTIISDDAGRYSPTDAVRWIGMVADAGKHYQHYDGPLGGRALAGQIIDGAEDFPTDSITVLEALQGRGTVLAANGVLSRDGQNFYWNEGKDPITLMGFGWHGAMVSLNFDIEGYLDALKLYQINLTRVFAIDQWTALATGCLVPEETCAPPDCCPTNTCTYDIDEDGCKDVILGNGRTPFGGSIFNSRYDLSELNQLYLSRLVQFVQAAWDRGIVVQLSLFEHHGLQNKPLDQERLPGYWPGSPYNQNNNINAFLASGPQGDAPADFLGQDGTDVGDVNSCFISTVVQQLTPYGNVIFEIMNEPKETDDWDEPGLLAWHEWVAGKVTGGACSNLPPEAGDDAFSTAVNTDLTMSLTGLVANDNDPDGDTVRGPFWENPRVTSAGGTLDWHVGGIVYHPPSGFVGTDTFDYTITDSPGGGECCRLVDIGTVTIEVGGIWVPPSPK